MVAAETPLLSSRCSHSSTTSRICKEPAGMVAVLLVEVVSKRSGKLSLSSNQSHGTACTDHCCLVNNRRYQSSATPRPKLWSILAIITSLVDGSVDEETHQARALGPVAKRVNLWSDRRGLQYVCLL